MTTTTHTKRPGVGARILDHVMAGVGYMIPVVMGGGILIALAFLTDDASIDPANAGSNTPLAKLFMTIGTAAFRFMLPVLAAFIGRSIGGNPALVLGLTGGYLAVEGGSGFLGALAAGFLAGGIALLLERLTRRLAGTFEGIRTMLLYPVFGVLLIGLAMQFAVNPPGRAINDGLTAALTALSGTSAFVLGAVLGGMMSVDMGGPVNKTAYLFATAALASGNYELMPAVMVGGMVPPLVSALATTIARRRFSADERQRGLTNYVMGASFISEGAIPFAAADPARFIPSCIGGSAVAGSLAMGFRCTLMAPAGGLWVLPLVTNPAAFVGALVAGCAVGTALYLALKKSPAADLHATVPA